MMRKIVVLGVLILQCLFAFSTDERHWKTHFAYNSVQQIAMDDSEVYALANGKIFTINQANEAMTLYNNFSGLHGTDVAQLAYDSVREQLLILYLDGKMDILRGKHMQYVPDLYNKQMTASKKCNNITIAGDVAYLSMDFGILTFDLNLYEFVDAYYIGPDAAEVVVNDVMLHGDSIYAQTSSVVYCARLTDNIVDFRSWRACATLPKSFDAKKGKEYVSKNGDVWKVSGSKGVARKLPTGEQVYYLPDGPQMNIPYKLVYEGGRLYMVSGGRWASQHKNPGHVMIYEKGKWINIVNSKIEKQTTKQALDFTDVVVDPQDASRFFVTSYGTGLYEFRHDSLYAHYTTENSILSSAVENTPDRYTRTASAVFDREQRLWVAVDGSVDTTLVCLMPDGRQRGVNFYKDKTSRVIFHTSADLLIDAVKPERKWMVSCRSTPMVAMLDDGGTSFEEKDDQCTVRAEFYDQDRNLLVPEFYYTLSQAPNGDIWIGSSIGPIIIPQSIDFLVSNQCHRLRLQDGSNVLDLERVNAFAWDDRENIWIGTQTGGVYVLNPEGNEIIARYTSSNSAMPSNTVMSLAYDKDSRQMFIGTGMGLVSYLQDPDATSNLYISDDEEVSYGTMYQWRAHPAFTKVDEVVVLGNKAFGLSSKALFSVDKVSEELKYYNVLNGLSGSSIDHIAYNYHLDRMLITYQDGKLDIMTRDGNIYTIPDLFLKQMNVSKQVNDICMYQDKAILAMCFGLLVVDMKKAEISDTYYIGEEGSEVYVTQVAVNDGKIYATTNNRLYYANLTDNLVDYSYWKLKSLPAAKTIKSMRAYGNRLYMIANQNDTLIHYIDKDEWKSIKLKRPMRKLCPTENHLYVLPANIYGVWEINSKLECKAVTSVGFNYDVADDNGAIWSATYANGLMKYVPATEAPLVAEYYPDGPINNYSYRLKFFGDKLYMLPGGRWASQYERLGEIMIYENGWWKNIKNSELVKKTGGQAIYDIMNVAQDPNDDTHYFMTSYGSGLLEMRDTSFVHLYTHTNSNLFTAAPGSSGPYTRTDGAMYDDQGNLWVLNAGSGNGNVHVISPDGNWRSFNLYANRTRIILHTPGEMFVDNRHSQWKWIPVLRAGTGLILLEDNGTPTNPSDDHVTYRTTWVDQYSNTLMPTSIHSVAQDKNGTLWIGTASGILTIPYNVDFRSSNQCMRVTIPRNDGTNLVDYLLDNEQINAIAVDGANRLWIGTATSGVFLMEPVGDVTDPLYYTMETVAHFTTENSIMPSNDILSIAIQESTGEVFIGTGQGLVSYMSDATQTEDNYNNLYAYPNPVHPTYEGYITIKGLVTDSEIRIVDSSGNLVKIIYGTGGSAVWDGKNAQGQRVASGVYTALCNTKTGTQHGSVKILIMN